MTSVFCGCSYVEGAGLENTSANPNLWVNQLHQQVFPHTELINLGRSGFTNEDIFASAVSAVARYSVQNLFVCWTELLRLNVNPAVELYDTNMYWGVVPGLLKDLGINPGITLAAGYVDNIKNRFFDLQHPHYKIVQVLHYSSIINDLCNKIGATAFFCNSLIEVDQGYFDPIVAPRLPSQTTALTRKWFNADTRDDEEFFKIYDKVHEEYKKTQGLQCRWLNIDRSFRRHFYVDQGSDRVHPGIKSNKLYADFLVKQLQTQF